MPDPGSTVSEQYTAEAGEEYFAYQLSGAETAARIAAPRFQPHIRPTDVVVDFGCGTGWLLHVLEAGDKLGIEPNPAARRVAESIGIATVPSPAEIADAHADVVVSNHALEHSLNPLAELRELHRILKPGGTLVMGLPIDDWRTQRRPDAANPDHHLFTWTPQLFSNLLEEAGFRPREVRAFTYLQPYHNDKLFPRLPRPVFDAISRVFGTVMRYRQLLAVADR